MDYFTKYAALKSEVSGANGFVINVAKHFILKIF